ncbi:MAG TPA: SDR family oxidoreductase [Pirellulales bacterium]|nr:SDR family oxidoreductase [Pirellulales bacterium]
MKSGSKILISGGSGGIGSAIALACAARGGWPIVGYVSHQERASDVVRRCGRGAICRIDVRDRSLDAPPAEAVVHCAAAYSPARSLLGSTDEMLAELLDVNLSGPLRLTRAAARSGELKRVVFVLSSASFCRGTGPYALAKAAELALCRLLANELAPRGVRVDAIVPGWTATDMAQQAAAALGRGLDEIAKDHPQGRILDPEEVGRLCAFLLFERADEPPGNLVVWDLRDGTEPAWHPLDDSSLAARNGELDSVHRL